MTKKEIELIASFTSLEVAINAIIAKQVVADYNFSANGLAVHFYKKDFELLQKQFKETKDKFYKILSDDEED